MKTAPGLAPTSQKLPRAVSTYAQLRDTIRETFLQGQRRIEEAKVQTYWQTGKYIHEHILQHKDRADYGKQVITKLAEDLEVSDSVLRRTIQFYNAFPISATSRKLTWAHYCELIPIGVERERIELAERAAKSEWSVQQLRMKVREEFWSDEARSGSSGKAHHEIKPVKLSPKLGELYTYRLLPPENVHGTAEGLWLDLGFNNHHYVTRGLNGLKAGQIVESVKHEDGSYSVRASKRGDKALFTYKALIERVVDGDTLVVKIDQGFNYRTRAYLRLRGIDCPELSEAAGKKAKVFVEKLLSKTPSIILTSSRNNRAGTSVAGTESDKYGRYVADVWVPKSEDRKDWIFLNQLLLDEGLAVRVHG